VTTEHYESHDMVDQYLLFHYGNAEDILPYDFGPVDALEFHRRCVDLLAGTADISMPGHGLDLGCAVGRATFELARHCEKVIGIDYSASFIAAAEQLKKYGTKPIFRVDEGDHGLPVDIAVPPDIDRTRTDFQQGDAGALPDHIGPFDVALLANLIDRLPDPRRCLNDMGRLLVSGGTLMICSPYTWLEEFTPRNQWLSAYTNDGEPLATIDALKSELGSAFKLIATHDVPFLIREHARKYQWSVSQATIWRRK